MAYNINNLKTAGKVTVLTTLLGVFVFAVVFLFNLPSHNVDRVGAQNTATTSVTVLNTPPEWTIDPQEVPPSSTTTPTNAGDTVTWEAIGTDPNSQPYYLLICTTNATPTPNSGSAPECDSPSNQWGVSAQTASAATSTVSTTTDASFAEVNEWYAWICDDDAVTPRCNNDVRQGVGESGSPFEVNHRPSFTAFSDDSPAVPGAIVTFSSTASDTDVSGVADTVQLWVCATNSFDTANDECTGTTLASSTLVASDPSATYTIVIPTQDTTYGAYGYVVDNHGFEASGGEQGNDSVLEVDNAPPTVSSSTISLNGGSDMVLTVESDETTGFTLDFTVTDSNSCEAVGGGDEVVDYVMSIYRSGVGSSTCDGTGGNYDANDCYESEVPTSVWNQSCTASSTSCGGATDTTMEFNCTFPLWYIADPTDGTATSTQFSTEDWRAAVSAVDDDSATSTVHTEGAISVEVTSFLAFSLNTITIPYGSLEPGQQTDPIAATTTIAATGNVGLDERLQGESMCPTYESGNPCPVSASSTIPEDQQVYATSTVAYASGIALSSTTDAELEVNIPKSITTSTPATGDTYWGIAVPGTITLSGDYTGENTFTAIVGESTDW